MLTVHTPGFMQHFSSLTVNYAARINISYSSEKLLPQRRRRRQSAENGKARWRGTCCGYSPLWKLYTKKKKKKRTMLNFNIATAADDRAPVGHQLQVGCAFQQTVLPVLAWWGYDDGDDEWWTSRDWITEAIWFMVENIKHECGGRRVILSANKHI